MCGKCDINEGNARRNEAEAVGCCKIDGPFGSVPVQSIMKGADGYRASVKRLKIYHCRADSSKPSKNRSLTPIVRTQ